MVIFVFFTVCFRLLAVHGLLQGDKHGLGRVRDQVHVAGPWRDDRQPVGGHESAGPMLVSDYEFAETFEIVDISYYGTRTTPFEPNLTIKIRFRRISNRVACVYVCLCLSSSYVKNTYVRHTSFIHKLCAFIHTYLVSVDLAFESRQSDGRVYQ